MAFPLIFFLVFATVRLSPTLRPIGWGQYIPPGVFAVALMIGVFTSFYPTAPDPRAALRAAQRRVRPVVAHGRSVEPPDHPRATSSRISSRRLLVWGAIAVATDILLEVGLSRDRRRRAGRRRRPGARCSRRRRARSTPPACPRPATTRSGRPCLPTFGILIAVVALNQVSEGTRRALEPWARPVMRLALYLLRRTFAGLGTLVAMVTITFLMYWALNPQPGALRLSAGHQDHAVPAEGRCAPPRRRPAEAHAVRRLVVAPRARQLRPRVDGRRR